MKIMPHIPKLSKHNDYIYPWLTCCRIFLLHFRAYSQVYYSLKVVDFRLMIKYFSQIQYGQTIIGSVLHHGHKIYFFRVWFGLGQINTGHYGVGVPKTLPRRTLVVLTVYLLFQDSDLASLLDDLCGLLLRCFSAFISSINCNTY